MERRLIILTVALVASLGVNAGLLLGPKFNGPSNTPPPERSDRSGYDDPFKLMRYADELSPELRDSFREEFRAQLPALRDEHGAMKAMRRELGVLMSADELDQDAVKAKLEEIRAAQERQHDVLSTAFVSAFEKLPAAERKMLIETANKRRHEHRKRRKERRGGDDAPPPPPPQD